VSGGTMPYYYLWNTTANTSQISNLTAGDYVATITDSKGCQAITDTITIGQPTGPLTASFNVTNVRCNSGNDGAVDLTTTGGTAPYSYEWGYGPTTEDINGLFEDLYVVTITDANDCVLIDSVNVTDPAPVVRHVTTTPSDCGFSNGTITLDSITGGTAPFIYTWETGATTAQIIGLASGDYDLSITDANSCFYMFTLHIGIDGEGTVSYTKHPILCYGGTASIDVQMISAIPPVTYYWSTNDIIISNDTLPAEYSGLLMGNYSVTVIDSLGCTGTIDNINIGQAPPQMIASIEPNHVSCRAYGNGQAIAHVIGGTQFAVSGQNPYSYSWNTGNTTDSIISNLVPGTYYVTIKDANDCQLIRDVEITQPAVFLQISVDVVTPVTCFAGKDGLIQISGIGGTYPYTYKWSNGQKTTSAINLEVGTYQVTITDMNGCDTTKSITVTQPEIIQISSITTSTYCRESNDGAIEISVVGGVGDYSYAWNTSPQQTTSLVKNLYGGDYIVSVTDANNCLMTDTITVESPDIECLEIPSCFTPNADGVNDTWEIRGIEFYPEAIVEIYNRWGDLIYKSDEGYLKQWDGKYNNGNDATVGSFVYIINLNSDWPVKTGVVTIIK
jgi:gliding motility-associated-like protein